MVDNVSNTSLGPADTWEAHLSTAKESILSRYLPKCDAILDELSIARVQRRSCEGGYGA